MNTPTTPMLRAHCAALVLAAAISPVALAGASPQVILTPVADTTIYHNEDDPFGDYSNGSNSTMFAGHTAGNANVAQRGLVRFDLSSVPPGSTISGAQFKLKLLRAGPTSGTVLVGIHRVSASWGEGASIGGGPGAPSEAGDASWFSRFFPTSIWTTPGGDFTAAPSATISMPRTLGFYTWGSTPGMVADVAAWVNNPGSNYGWLIQNDETPGTAREFASRESGTPADRPTLIVDYTVAPAACNPADICGVGATYDNGTVDIGPDQQLTIEDFLNFLSAFGDATGCPGTGPCNPADICGVGATYDNGTVDIGPDGDLTIEDFLNFLSAFGDATGCP